jgi:hypothetical protein
VSEFIPGLELSRSFFVEVVQPIIGDRFPSLRYAAALLGSGSEVLGFDTVMSSDHHWGPRVDLFVPEGESQDLRLQILHALRTSLPPTFRGYSTNFSDPDPADNGVRQTLPVEAGPINHMIPVQTPREFFQSYLQVDLVNSLETGDWLTIPEQKLLTIGAGKIFHDEIGLSEIRERFRYYPRDVWLYLLACGWRRVSQEEHLMGRAGAVGDEIGSGLIAGRLVRDLMRLCFLMERVYAPYPKWFGTAFRGLRCAAALDPHLRRALTAETWLERERGLIPAYEMVATMHNELQITAPLPSKVKPFFGRPFQVIALNGFPEAIVDQITDETVRRLVSRPLIGGLDQLSDNTDLLSSPEWRLALKRLYQ